MKRVGGQEAKEIFIDIRTKMRHCQQSKHRNRSRWQFLVFDKIGILGRVIPWIDWEVFLYHSNLRCFLLGRCLWPLIRLNNSEKQARQGSKKCWTDVIKKYITLCGCSCLTQLSCASHCVQYVQHFACHKFPLLNVIFSNARSPCGYKQRWVTIWYIYLKFLIWFKTLFVKADSSSICRKLIKIFRNNHQFFELFGSLYIYNDRFLHNLKFLSFLFQSQSSFLTKCFGLTVQNVSSLLHCHFLVHLQLSF